MLIILLVIGLLSLLIVAHELGHLVTAKLAGVKVEEFGLGFPPRLVAFRWGETEYSLNLILFGGFVRLQGEDIPQGPRSLAAKSKKVRFMVLSAGVMMNILLPVFLFTTSFMLPRQVMVGEVTIVEVAPGSPAQRAGLQPGDRVVAAAGQRLHNHLDLTYYIRLHLGRPLELEVERRGERHRLSLVPRWRPPAGQGAIGVLVTTRNRHTETVSYGPWPAFTRGVRTLMETFQLLRTEVLSWIVGRSTPQVGGPVAIVHMAGEAARAGPSPLLAFIGFISINLALVNLLPLPGLDGGRLLFLGVEAVRRGRRISPERERLVHFLGFVLLLALLVVVSYYDLVRLASGDMLR